MKNIFKFLGLAAGASVLLSVSSCKEDFLEVEYTDILPTEMMTANDEGAESGLMGCYKMMLPSSYAGDWGLKPNLFFGCHPTLDTQATGWDTDWCKQNWGPDSEALGQAWNHVYNAISRCNDFIREIKTANCSDAVKTQVIAEAQALRGFYYHWLAQAFGRVPVLLDNETYISAPEKARAATDAEMWDAVIVDLKAAADVLDWKPRNGQYGRCTKGMALTYLADAYMWKAYRCKQPDLYATARDIFKQIIESGTYELQHAYSTLFEPVNNNWNSETIWAEILDERDSFDGNQYGSFMHLKWYTGCKQTGGWGTLFLSWEWYLCYEQGDRRRDGSACTGPVEQLKTDFPEAVSEYCYGQNPFCFDTIPALTDPKKPAKYLDEEGKEVDNTSFASHYQYKEESGWAPSVWTLKYWREPLSWSCNQPHCPIYYMRYANVLLLYAECCFRTNQESDGWDAINQLRNRAWGNLEADVDGSKFAPYYATKYAQNKDGYGPARIDRAAALMKAGYPIPFQKTTVEVPDAKTVYTQLKADKGFTSDVWVVAVGTEYRKEFNAEWCLAPALIRLDFLEDHLNVNYPKNMNPKGDRDNWHTQRDYDFNPAKVLMPIPADELKRNPLCDQNEAYRVN